MAKRGPKPQTHCKHGHAFTPKNTIIRTDGRRRCRECTKRQSREQRERNSKANPKYFRAQNLKNFYKISIEEYDNKLETQLGKCANSRCPFTAVEEGRSLSIDHDHTCCPGKQTCGECARGILCRRCNMVIGAAHDDENYLLGLVDYLRFWKTSNERNLQEPICGQ